MITHYYSKMGYNIIITQKYIALIELCKSTYYALYNIPFVKLISPVILSLGKCVHISAGFSSAFTLPGIYKFAYPSNTG